MENIWLSLILSTALAALAIWRKAVTYPGTALAWVLCVVLAYFGGVTGFFALAATFVFTMIAGKLSGKKREKLEKKLHAKSGARDSAQVFCNVGLSAIMAAVYGLTDKDAFLCACGAALAASLADSLASELGILNKTPPRDICTLKKVQPGISGGVSPLGLAMSFVGAAIIGLICLGWGKGFAMSSVIVLCGFLAALVDSVLGSRVQAKYRCGVCGALTEKKVHCAQPGALEKGLAFVNNDMVNFLNNLSAVILALLLF